MSLLPFTTDNVYASLELPMPDVALENDLIGINRVLSASLPLEFKEPPAKLVQPPVFKDARPLAADFPRLRGSARALKEQAHYRPASESYPMSPPYVHTLQMQSTRLLHKDAATASAAAQQSPTGR